MIAPKVMLHLCTHHEPFTVAKNARFFSFFHNKRLLDFFFQLSLCSPTFLITDVVEQLEDSVLRKTLDTAAQTW